MRDLLFATVLGSLAFLVAATTAEADVAKAAVHFDRGTRLYQVGEYARAVEEFKAGHIEDPDPSFLYNIAQCLRQLGQSKEALTIYRRFLSLAPDTPMRPDVERRIRELEETVRNQPVVEPTRVAAGVALRPPAQLAPVDSSATGSAATLSRRPDAADPRLTASAPSRWPAWLAGALTVALAGGATVATLTTNARFANLKDSCGTTAAGCSDSEINEIRSRGRIVNGLWALAGASAVATGIAIYATGRETMVAVALAF